MKRMPGLEFTQHTVAFPTLDIHVRGCVEEIMVMTTDGEGEFALRWYDHSKHGGSNPFPVRIECFTSGGYDALRRCMPVLDWMGGWSPTVEQVIDQLTMIGAIPSTYHSRGLAESCA